MKIITKTIQQAEVIAVTFTTSRDRQQFCGFIDTLDEAKKVALLPLGIHKSTGFTTKINVDIDDSGKPLNPEIIIFPTAVDWACENLTYNKAKEYGLLPD